jgi:dethiobiotin synthetase
VRGLFVTGTDTGVGKTVLSAALLAAMAAAGEPVGAYKPVVTGLDEAAPGAWPPDHELLGAAAGIAPQAVSPLRLGPPAAPHLAARLTGAEIDPAELIAAARRAAAPGRALVVEGVGGLLVPLGDRFLVRDLARALGLPLLLAARPGLGTINHTLLSVEAARAGGLTVRAVVLTPWPHDPGVLERSNLETIARLGEVEVATLPPIGSPAPAALAEGGAGLPWRRWLQPAPRPSGQLRPDAAGSDADPDPAAVVAADADASIAAVTRSRSPASIT